MIFLKTGQPGTGKTLNAIDDVLSTISKDKEGKQRPVFAYGITGLNIPEWTPIDKQQAEEWYNLPNGCVVVIDECQDLWRPRKAGTTVPESVQRMEKHRHQGIDIVLTCQFPRQIDQVVRKLVGQHDHYFRPFGLETVSVLSWDKCEESPDDYHAKNKAQKKRIHLNKDIFELYKSAEVHTVKKKIPKKFYVFLILLFLLFCTISFIVYYFSTLGTSEQPTNSDNAQPTNNHQAPSFTPKRAYTYLELNTPEIEGFPHTAPIWSAKSVKQPPIPTGCVSNESSCSCYTQQATKMHLDLAVCRSIIANNGFYNPYQD